MKWIRDAAGDTRYAVRSLARTPLFTFVAVLTLGLGVGAVTLIASVIDDVLISPLPYPDSHRLVNVLVQDKATGRARWTVNRDEFREFREHSTSFDGVIGTLGETMRLTSADQVELIRGVWVTANFFDFMGLPPLHGRTATADDVSPGAAPVAVLRYRAWVTYFAADPAVIGRTITLNGEARTIVGVMPPRFTWHAADVWLIRPVEHDRPQQMRTFQARLKRGVTTEEAGAQLDVVAARLAKLNPSNYPPSFRVQVANVIEFTVGGFSRVLYLALGAVALLMVIACCNVANMLLARATAREREMSVRAALGAGRSRIVRQLLVESLLLGASGAVLGSLIAFGGMDALVKVLPVMPLPGEVEIALDARAYRGHHRHRHGGGAAVRPRAWCTTARAAISWKGSRGRARRSPAAADVSGTRSSSPRSRCHSSCCCRRGCWCAASAGSPASISVSFPATRCSSASGLRPIRPRTAAARYAYFQRALDRLRSVPGVEAVAATTYLPPFGGPTATLELQDRSGPDQRSAIVQLCTGDCLRVLGIELIRGDGLRDLRDGEPPRLAIVNETLARESFAGEDPIGKRIRLSAAGVQSDPSRHGVFEIAGIVRDVRNDGLSARPAPHVYLPGAISARGMPSIVVRTRGDAAALVHTIRKELIAIDPQVAVPLPRVMTELLDRSLYAQPRFTLIVLGLFAATGTLLVAVGLFGVMAYTVSLQTREIALRMALGAGRTQVLRTVLGLGARLLGAGLLLGLPASLGATRLLREQLWEVPPYDPLTIVLATALMLAVALLACLVPARRALRIEPVAALRQE